MNAKSNLFSHQPSFSITSGDFSRQYNNHSISEIKAYHRNVFSNTSTSQISLFQQIPQRQQTNNNSKKPKEIEELFESTRNIYKNRGNTISGSGHVQTLANRGYQFNQQMRDYQKGQGIVNQKKLSQNSHILMSQSSNGQSKKQNPTGKIDKKLCTDDEAQAFTSLVSYKQAQIPKSDSSNSIGESSQSSSPSLTQSMQRQRRLEARCQKVSNPFGLESKPEFQTFSIPSSNNSQKGNLLQGKINLTSTNTFDKKNSTDQNLRNLIQKVSSTNPTTSHNSLRNHIHQTQSLDGTLINLKNKNNQGQSNIERKNGKNDNRLIISNENYITAQSAIQQEKYVPITQINIGSSDLFQNYRHSISTYRCTPKTKLNLIGGGCPQSAPKIQDLQNLPMPKTLKDDSADEETIDSQDMSRSFIKRSFKDNLMLNTSLTQQTMSIQQNSKFTSKRGSAQVGGNRQSENGIIAMGRGSQMASPQLQQTVNKVFSFNEMKVMGSQQALQQNILQTYDQHDNQQRDSLQKLDSVKNLTIQKYRSTSTASKRAKWDFSASKPNATSTNEGLTQATFANESGKEKDKIAKLQEQYLAIKKQLMELQGEKKKEKIEKEDSQHREIVGVLSPDRHNKSSQSSLDGDNESSSLSSCQLKTFQKSKHETSQQTFQTQQKSQRHTKTAQKQQVRHKKEGPHFKSVDVKFNPQIICNNKQENSPKLKFPSNLQNASKQSNQNKKSHNETRNLQKANIMKSQLQLGIRKLSINKQLLEDEYRFDHSQQITKKKENHTRKSSFKRKHTRKENSQVSFVGVSGESQEDSSEERYKDCLSGNTRKKGFKKQCYDIKSSVMSSGSSNYHNAYDGESNASSSICSCCRQEMENDHSKSNHRSKKRITNQQSSKNIQQSKGKQKYKEILNEKEQDSRQDLKKSTRKSNRKDFQNDKDKYDQKQTTKKSSTHQKKKSSSRHDKRSRSREERYSESTYIKSKNIDSLQNQNAWLLQQHFQQQLPIQSMRQSYDQIKSMWPTLQQNPQLYAQSLAQPQVINSVFSQLQSPSHQMFIPNQAMLQSQLLQNPQILSQSLQLNRKSPKSNSHKNKHNSFLPLQIQQQSIDVQNLEAHREQIEVIEQLIQVAKQKLEANIISNQGQTCRIQESDSIHQQTNKKSSRNKVQLQGQNSYNSHREHQTQSLFYKSQQTNCSDMLEDQEYERSNDKQSSFINKRRYSEQQDFSSRFQETKNAMNKDKKSLNMPKEYDSKKKIAKQLEQLSGHFTQDLSVIGNQKSIQMKQKDKEQSKQFDNEDYQTFNKKQKNETKLHQIKEEKHLNQKHQEEYQEYCKEVLWVDLNDDNMKQPKSSTQRHSINSNTLQPTARRPHEHMPSSIPEEREEDFASPVPFQQPQIVLKNQKQQQAQKQSWAMDFTITDKNDQDQKAINLADAFRKKMGSSIIESKTPRSTTHREKKDFTKEELLERKKELLKSARDKVKSRQNQDLSVMNPEDTFAKVMNKTQVNNELASMSQVSSTKVIQIDIFNKNAIVREKAQVDPKIIVLSRLSTGQKPEISKKDMLKLTSKNYEQLPEIKKKKEEGIKKEELLKRIANVKELERKRRQSVVSKRNAMNALNSKTSKTIDIPSKQQ